MAVKRCGLVFGVLVMVLTSGSRVFGATANELDSLMGQWLSLEKQKNAVQAHWQQQAPLLQQRIQLLTAKSTQLTEQIHRQEQQNQQAFKEMAVQVESLSTQHLSIEQIQAWIASTEQSLSQLLIKLPPPLQNTLKELSTAAPLENEGSLVAQFNQQLAAIEAIEMFNAKISIYESLIVLSDGSSVLASQLYFGLPFGWFTSADGSVSGIGRVHDNTWHWQQDAHVDGVEVNKAIAIAAKQQDVAPVTLPVQLMVVSGE